MTLTCDFSTAGVDDNIFIKFEADTVCQLWRISRLGFVYIVTLISDHLTFK